jgi:hypothetical protein
MKFRVTRTSDWNGKDETIIEIASLDDLVAFQKKSENPVIVTQPWDEDRKLGCAARLEIYDDYRE